MMDQSHGKVAHFAFNPNTIWRLPYGCLDTKAITITYFPQDLNFLVPNLRMYMPINTVYCVLSKQFIYWPLTPYWLQRKLNAQS